MKIVFLILKIVLVLAIIAAGLAVWLWPRHSYLEPSTRYFEATRLAGHPIISDATCDAPGVDRAACLSELSAQGYINVSGPSLIRVPAWADVPLGNYYLYFAHHKGDSIRLAYADDIHATWSVHPGGVLSLADSGFPVEYVEPESDNQALGDIWDEFSIHVVRDYLIMNYQATVRDRRAREARGLAPAAASVPHLASPEVVIDQLGQRFIMFYHGLEYGNRQLTRIAVSEDGLRFNATNATVPSPYVRHFELRGKHYLLGMPGVLFRADDILGPYEPRDQILFDPTMRHSALLLEGDSLFVFFSRAGDSPERILFSEVDVSSDDWDSWQATDGFDVIKPEEYWEGASLQTLPSLRGEVTGNANEIRDPYVFIDQDGVTYLLYSAGGEKAIGAAILN